MENVTSLYKSIARVLSVLTTQEVASLDSSQPILEAAINKIFNRQINETSLSTAGDVLISITTLQAEVAQLKACGGVGGSCKAVPYNDQCIRDELANLRNKIDDYRSSGSSSSRSKRKRKKVGFDSSSSSDDDDDHPDYSKEIKSLRRRVKQLEKDCDTTLDRRVRQLENNSNTDTCQLEKRIRQLENDNPINLEKRVRQLENDNSVNLERSIDQFEKRLIRLENRSFSQPSTSNNNDTEMVDSTLLDTRFDRLQAKMETNFERKQSKLEAKIEKLQTKINTLQSKIDACCDADFEANLAKIQRKLKSIASDCADCTDQKARNGISTLSANIDSLNNVIKNLQAEIAALQAYNRIQPTAPPIIYQPRPVPRFEAGDYDFEEEEKPKKKKKPPVKKERKPPRPPKGSDTDDDNDRRKAPRVAIEIPSVPQYEIESFDIPIKQVENIGRPLIPPLPDGEKISTTSRSKGSEPGTSGSKRKKIDPSDVDRGTNAKVGIQKLEDIWDPNNDMEDEYDGETEEDEQQQETVKVKTRVVGPEDLQLNLDFNALAKIQTDVRAGMNVLNSNQKVLIDAMAEIRQQLKILASNDAVFSSDIAQLDTDAQALGGVVVDLQNLLKEYPKLVGQVQQLITLDFDTRVTKLETRENLEFEDARSEIMSAVGVPVVNVKAMEATNENQRVTKMISEFSETVSQHTVDILMLKDNFRDYKATTDKANTDLTQKLAEVQALASMPDNALNERVAKIENCCDSVDAAVNLSTRVEEGYNSILNLLSEETTRRATEDQNSAKILSDLNENYSKIVTQLQGSDTALTALATVNAQYDQINNAVKLLNESVNGVVTPAPDGSQRVVVPGILRTLDNLNTIILDPATGLQEWAREVNEIISNAETGLRVQVSNLNEEYGNLVRKVDNIKPVVVTSEGTASQSEVGVLRTEVQTLTTRITENTTKLNSYKVSVDNYETAYRGIQATMKTYAQDAKDFSETAKQINLSLSNSVTTTTLNSYYTAEQTKKYVKEEFDNYTKVELANYATTDTLKTYATLEAISSFVMIQTLDSYVKQGELHNLVTNSLGEKLKPYLTTEEYNKNTPGYVKSTDLNNYAKNSDLGTYATVTSLSSYVKSSELTKYILKTTFDNTIADYTKTDTLKAEYLRKDDSVMNIKNLDLRYVRDLMSDIVIREKALDEILKKYVLKVPGETILTQTDVGKILDQRDYVPKAIFTSEIGNLATKEYVNTKISSIPAPEPMTVDGTNITPDVDIVALDRTVRNLADRMDEVDVGREGTDRKSILERLKILDMDGIGVFNNSLIEEIQLQDKRINNIISRLVKFDIDIEGKPPSLYTRMEVVDKDTKERQSLVTQVAEIAKRANLSVDVEFATEAIRVINAQLELINSTREEATAEFNKILNDNITYRQQLDKDFAAVRETLGDITTAIENTQAVVQGTQVEQSVMTRMVEELKNEQRIKELNTRVEIMLQNTTNTVGVDFANAARNSIQDIIKWIIAIVAYEARVEVRLSALEGALAVDLVNEVQSNATPPPRLTAIETSPGVVTTLATTSTDRESRQRRTSITETAIGGRSRSPLGNRQPGPSSRPSSIVGGNSSRPSSVVGANNIALAVANSQQRQREADGITVTTVKKGLPTIITGVPRQALDTPFPPTVIGGETERLTVIAGQPGTDATTPLPEIQAPLSIDDWAGQQASGGYRKQEMPRFQANKSREVKYDPKPNPDGSKPPTGKGKKNVKFYQSETTGETSTTPTILQQERLRRQQQEEQARAQALRMDTETSKTATKRGRQQASPTASTVTDLPPPKITAIDPNRKPGQAPDGSVPDFTVEGLMHVDATREEIAAAANARLQTIRTGQIESEVPKPPRSLRQ